MDELEALRIVRDEAYQVWRELSKVRADEEQGMAERLGQAIDVVDAMIEDRPETETVADAARELVRAVEDSYLEFDIRSTERVEPFWDNLIAALAAYSQKKENNG